MTKRIGVVGSRDYRNEALVRATVASLPGRHGDIILVSGGAYRRTKKYLNENPKDEIYGGVDYWAEQQAEIAGIPTDILHAKWNTFGKAAGFIRNEKLVESCDEVYIFWDGKSNGTRNVIKHCKNLKIPFHLKGDE